MPRLAANMSFPLTEALCADAISVDYIKVPLSAYPENLKGINEARRHGPLLLHPTQAGVLDISQIGDDMALGEAALLQLLTLTQTPSLSTHATMTRDSIPPGSEAWDGPSLRNAVMGNAVRHCLRARLVVDTYGPGTPMLLENHSFWPGVLPFSCEPEFINETAREAGVDILLDIAHARVTNFMGIDVRDLIMRFDLDRVGELHVSGPRVYPGVGMVDEHREMLHEDYSLLAWVLERTSPKIVSLEYGGMNDVFTLPNGQATRTERNDVGALIRQVNLLSGILHP